MSLSTDARPSPLAPLAGRTFLWFWLAFTVSTIGISSQALGAQWFLVRDASSAGLVALVQAAMTFPLALLSLPAGVLADRVDRRSMLIAVQAFGLLMGAVLTWLSWTGSLGPRTLLALTFALGSAYALTLTPFQAVVPDVVPRRHLHEASALVSIAANTARVVGPALAGLLVARVDIPAVFALSTLTSAFFLVVLVRWKGIGRDAVAAGAVRPGGPHRRPLHPALTPGAQAHAARLLVHRLHDGDLRAPPARRHRPAQGGG